MAIFNPNMARTSTPPVMAARRWIEGVEFSPEKPLLNVSQAAPVAAPTEALRQAMADAAMHNCAAHLYGPVLGLPELRAEIATQWSAAYRGKISASEVAITSGCNQAFCAAISMLAAPGDEVILPSPWYFNHKMWLDMAGVTCVPLETGADLLPDPAKAAALITPRSRAIVLVTPNNPGGVEYSPALVRAFYELAKAHDLALIIDETYRDFHSAEGAPHDLFTDPDWGRTVIQLYSFSKAYRLTGHRVGAMIASPERLSQAEKFLDSVTICPNQLGQISALWGMQNLGEWLAGERDEILARRAAIAEGFQALEGWKLLGAGAYFAYVQHPFDMASPEVAQRMVKDAEILALPGTMFTPEGSVAGAQQMRFAFANIDIDAIKVLFERLSKLRL